MHNSIDRNENKMINNQLKELLNKSYGIDLSEQKKENDHLSTTTTTNALTNRIKFMSKITTPK